MKSSKLGDADGFRGSPPITQSAAPGDGFGNSHTHHHVNNNRSGGRRFGNSHSGPGNRSRGGGFGGYRDRPGDRNHSKPTFGPSHSDDPRVPSPQERELTAKFTKLLEAQQAADGGCYTDDDEVSVTKTPLTTPSKEDMLDEFKNLHGVNINQSLEGNNGFNRHSLNVSPNSEDASSQENKPSLEGKPSNEKYLHPHPKRYTKKTDKKSHRRSHQVSTSSSGYSGGMSSSPASSPEVPHRWRTSSRQKTVSESKPAPSAPAARAKQTDAGETLAGTQSPGQLTRAAFLREGGPINEDTPDILKMVGALLQNDKMRSVLKKRDPQLYDQMIKYVMDTAALSLNIQ